MDWRGAPGVPLALFPEDDRLVAPPRLGPRARQAIAGAIEELTALRLTVTASTRRDGGFRAALERARAATTAVVDTLGPLLARVEAAAVPGEPGPHDMYMGVRRAHLSPEAAAAESAVIVDRALADLS